MGTKYAPGLGVSITPSSLPSAAGKSGYQRCAAGIVEVAVGDLDVDDIIIIATIPSHAIIPALFLGWDDLGTTVTMDLGIYTTAGTAKDADYFATALAGGTATAMTDQRFEAAAANIDGMGKALWELAGDTADPGVLYDIALTVTASTAPSAGTIAYRIPYLTP